MSAAEMKCRLICKVTVVGRCYFSLGPAVWAKCENSVSDQRFPDDETGSLVLYQIANPTRLGWRTCFYEDLDRAVACT